MQMLRYLYTTTNSFNLSSPDSEALVVMMSACVLNSIGQFQPKLSKDDWSLTVSTSGVFWWKWAAGYPFVAPFRRKALPWTHYYLSENQDKRVFTVSSTEKNSSEISPWLRCRSTKLQQLWLHWFWCWGRTPDSQGVQTGAWSLYTGSLWAVILSFNTWPQAISNTHHPVLVLNTEPVFCFEASS